VPKPVAEMPALTVMLLCARNSNEFALAQVTVFDTVMLPALAKGLVVSTMTLFVPRAVWSVVTFKLEVAAVPVKVGPAVILEFAAVEIVISVGSNSSVPVCPAGADVSTVPSKASVLLPDTSTNPPLPPDWPPFAEMLPPKPVWPSDQMTTVPPSPSPTASAVIVAPDATTVEIAFCSGPAPR
jgi:hypothetical protein